MSYEMLNADKNRLKNLGGPYGRIAQEVLARLKRKDDDFSKNEAKITEMLNDSNLEDEIIETLKEHAKNDKEGKDFGELEEDLTYEIEERIKKSVYN